jgi:hypothetical protein
MSGYYETQLIRGSILLGGKSYTSRKRCIQQAREYFEKRVVAGWTIRRTGFGKWDVGKGDHTVKIERW